VQTIIQPNLFPFPGNANDDGPSAADASRAEEEPDDVAPQQTDTSASNPPAVCVVSLAPNGSQFVETSLVSTPSTTVDIERVILPPGFRLHAYFDSKGQLQQPTGFSFTNASGQVEYWSYSLIPIGKKPKIQIPPKAQRMYRFGYSFLNDSGVWEYVSTGPTGH
jgi:hypothetical protein